MAGALINHQPLRELDQRSNDGIEVTLLWGEADNRVLVLVVNTCSLEAFELEAEPAAALDVFDHPFAYAAFRGIDYGVGAETPAEVCA